MKKQANSCMSSFVDFVMRHTESSSITSLSLHEKCGIKKFLASVGYPCVTIRKREGEYLYTFTECSECERFKEINSFFRFRLQIDGVDVYMLTGWLDYMIRFLVGVAKKYESRKKILIQELRREIKRTPPWMYVITH